jgi:hypothetical protein
MQFAENIRSEIMATLPGSSGAERNRPEDDKKRCLLFTDFS